MDVLKFYGEIEKNEYLYTSEIGRKRIEEIESIFDKIKPFLGKRILDIGCGAGLFTFYFEQKGYKILGIDISKELIKDAINIKKKLNFKSNFVLVNALNFKSKLKFDSAIIFGNTLWEFSPKNFVNLIKNLKNFASNNFHILIQYRSLIKEIINDKEVFKASFPYPNIAEIFESYDDFNSIAYWRYLDLKNEKTSTSKGFAAWSAGFLEAIMNALNFELKERIESNTIYTDWLDVYELKS